MALPRTRGGAAVLCGLGAFMALTACGDTSQTGSSGELANTPCATPDAATNVNCPGSGGPSSGSLTGLGATIGQFRQAHPQDPKYTSQFGSTISGGPNDGLPELTAFCSPAGLVVSVSQNLSQPSTDAKLKASLLTFGIAPADAKLQSAQTPGTGSCELLFYQSPSIAADAGANDTAGTFVVELEPPAEVAAKGWDPNNVASLLYDLDTSGGC